MANAQSDPMLGQTEPDADLVSYLNSTMFFAGFVATMCKRFGGSLTVGVLDLELVRNCQVHAGVAQNGSLVFTTVDHTQH